MADEAVFTRKVTDDGGEFEITPASVSGGSAGFFMAFFLIAGFCIIMSAQRSSPIVMFGAVIVGIGLPLWFWAKVRRQKQERSIKTTIRIAKDGSMTAGSRTFEAGDVAELLFVDPNGNSLGSTRVFAMGTGPAGGAATAALVGASIVTGAFKVAAAAQAERSYSIAVRRRSNSTPVTIATGLTLEPGRALLRDLAEAFQSV